MPTRIKSTTQACTLTGHRTVISWVTGQCSTNCQPALLIFIISPGKCTVQPEKRLPPLSLTHLDQSASGAHQTLNWVLLVHVCDPPTSSICLTWELVSLAESKVPTPPRPTESGLATLTRSPDVSCEHSR